MEAAEKSIPKRTPHRFKKTLPKEILELIRTRKKIRRKWIRKKRAEDKIEYNRLSNQVKAAITKHRNTILKAFIEAQGPNPISSKPFGKG